MKTTVRIIALASVFTLAGVLTTAWGAESVATLISQGEEIITKIETHKAAFDAALQKNNALVPEGKQIRDDMQQLQTDIAAMNKQNADLKQQTDDYKAKCDGKQLSQDQYKACKDQLAQINKAISDIKTQPAKLKKRQDDIMARANKYNQEIQIAPKQVTTEETAYHNAELDQQDWLQKARTLVAQPAFQQYAKKAGCPNVEKTPKNMDEIMAMSVNIITCLKKVAGSN